MQGVFFMNEKITISKQAQIIMILFLCTTALYFLFPIFSFINFFFAGNSFFPGDTLILNMIQSLYSGITFLFATIIYIFLWIYYVKLKKIGYHSKMLLILNILLPSIDTLIIMFTAVIFSLLFSPHSTEVIFGFDHTFNNTIKFIFTLSIISFIKNIFYLVWGAIILKKLNSYQQNLQTSENNQMTRSQQEIIQQQDIFLPEENTPITSTKNDTQTQVQNNISPLPPTTPEENEMMNE